MIDTTLYVHPSGAIWQEAHWYEARSIDDPMPKYRVVEIKDGTDQAAPMIVYVMPNRAQE